MAKPGISSGVAAGSRHTGLATKLRPRLRVDGGVADSISLRASGVVSEHRLFQVKNEKKKIFRSDFVLPAGEHCDRI